MRLRITSTLALALAACVAAGTALAQPPQGGGFGLFGGPGAGLSPMRLAPALQTKLNLTADQKMKLQGIQQRMMGEMRELFQGGGGPEAFGKIRELNQKAETEALALFTADQRKQFDAWKTEIANYRSLGRSGQALLVTTGLTEEQKGKLKTLSMQMEGKYREAFQGLQGGGGGGQIREKLMALDNESVTAVKGILTPDQQKEFDAALPPQGPGRRPGGGN